MGVNPQHANPSTNTGIKDAAYPIEASYDNSHKHLTHQSNRFWGVQVTQNQADALQRKIWTTKHHIKVCWLNPGQLNQPLMLLLSIFFFFNRKKAFSEGNISQLHKHNLAIHTHTHRAMRRLGRQLCTHSCLAVHTLVSRGTHQHLAGHLLPSPLPTPQRHLFCSL